MVVGVYERCERMAKKSFRGGLGSLLEDTFKKTGQETPANQQAYERNNEMEVLLAELALWRSGEMNLEAFLLALDEADLMYNAETNTIVKKSV